MAKFAVIQGDTVTNIIVADIKEAAEAVTNSTCIEYTDETPVGVGYTWNGKEFNSPAIKEVNE
jgi:hypothetical protein